MSELRRRIRAGERVIGTFGKIPDPHVVELLGLAGLDFVVADQEHGAIGTSALDLMVMAGRATGLPVLVRGRDESAAALWPALDLGAGGVMVPHVTSGEQAAAIAAAVRYVHGARGFSPSGRAGRYGTMGAAAYRSFADETNVILAQIEDRAAVDNLAGIAAQPDIDVLFVGPVDLALSLGCDAGSPELTEAIEAVIAAARAAGKQAGLFVASADEVERWSARGVTVFVVGADQSLLLSGAKTLMQQAAERSCGGE
ncbi:HpcH/HpaI aldolase family protein [Celeribacter indicus]|uniref:HpcH/HpaI aldolase n=1 Tax=Celeribacter indicus TaxID=1208324 RepID=A0A0B5E002_9RHOB|nr:aldolase/citrate lyase family protein [Celeribacter indicus]AJE46705.1 HpcH/HpaI aldolase [Celeribacter indicus]SDX04406.1 2-keto-3-deoxy-L-rhamnonate aldolase RhmA [Celeribacter indicus]